jgi:hypothetical protein
VNHALPSPFAFALFVAADWVDHRSVGGHSRGVGLQLSNHFAIGQPPWEFSWIGGPGFGRGSSSDVGPGEGSSG